MLDWAARTIAEGDYVAVAALMFAENLFPPIPSEIIMPLAGYAAAQGKLSLWGVSLAGTAGAVAGAVVWFAVGWWIGPARLMDFARRWGRLLTLTPREIDRADAWFDRHGGKTVFAGRLVPGVRTLISMPAGLARMPLVAFGIYSTAGTALWSTLLAVAGYGLGARHQELASTIGMIGDGVIGALVIGYLWRVATFRRHTPKD